MQSQKLMSCFGMSSLRMCVPNQSHTADKGSDDKILGITALRSTRCSPWIKYATVSIQNATNPDNSRPFPAIPDPSTKTIVSPEVLGPLPRRCLRRPPVPDQPGRRAGGAASAHRLPVAVLHGAAPGLVDVLGGPVLLRRVRGTPQRHCPVCRRPTALAVPSVSFVVDSTVVAWKVVVCQWRSSGRAQREFCFQMSS